MTSSEPGEHSPNDSLPTIPDQRGLWPLDPTVVHLNHGSYGATPRAAEPVMAALRREKDARPMAWYGGLVERVAAARSEVARWLGAEPDQTALVSNATAAATVVFRSLTFAEGDEIVVTDHGYGAVTNAARRAARRSGARLVSVSIPLLATADEVVALVEAAFTARTRVLLIDQITSPTGLLFPVDRLCDLARRHDVLSVIDGAHAPGMLAEPVVAEADVWFGNLHKWACAPRASAALVARPDLAQHLDPVIDSWYADEPYPDVSTCRAPSTWCPG